jgi:hypothetical protein
MFFTAENNREDSSSVFFVVALLIWVYGTNTQSDSRSVTYGKELWRGAMLSYQMVPDVEGQACNDRC